MLSTKLCRRYHVAGLRLGYAGLMLRVVAWRLYCLCICSEDFLSSGRLNDGSEEFTDRSLGAICLGAKLIVLRGIRVERSLVFDPSLTIS